MSLIFSLFLLIVAGRILGRIFAGLGQPALVGEMVAGILLGPAALNTVHVGLDLQAISNLSVFFIVLCAGLELSFDEVKSSLAGRGMIAALLSFIFPFICGVGLGRMYELNATSSCVLGVCMSITALPVAIRILQSFKMVRSDIGKRSIGMALFDDVIALLILGAFIGRSKEQGLELSALVPGVFKLGILLAAIFFFKFMMRRLELHPARFQAIKAKLRSVTGAETALGGVIFFVLAMSALSESLGFPFMIGTFFAGLLIEKRFFTSGRFQELETSLHSITEGFLAPVFFGYLGLEFKLGAIPSVQFVAGVLIVATLTKFVAGWVGGLLGGLSAYQSLGVGIILNGRGVMELVVASIAYEHGLIDQGVFSTLVLMGVVTTLMTPILFRKLLGSRMAKDIPSLSAVFFP